MQMQRLLHVWVLVLVTSGVWAKLFEQNCASRGLCSVPLDLRPPALHATKPSHPKGHLKPLGHPDFDESWDGEIDEFDGEIEPQVFWKKYYPHRPFVMRGVGKRHPAYHKWKDDKYLAENFGSLKVKCENKNEDRLTDYCHQHKLGHRVQCPESVVPYVETYMNISNFLKQYKEPSHDTYAISQLPTGMAGDVLVSPAWNCGNRPEAEHRHNSHVAQHPWKTQLYETNLWINHNFGENFSSSVIHYDMNHQMMCLYDGEKEWFFWDLRHNIQHIPTWSQYYSQQQKRPRGSDDSPIDGERVDLLSYPEFKQARWTNTTLRAGDCMYTPAWIMHYVRSTGRNIAGMYMFQTETRFDPKSCTSDQAKSASVPLDQFDVLWEFPGLVKNGAGYNQVKMGYPNWKRHIREPMIKRLSKSGKVAKRDLMSYVYQLGQGAMDQEEVMAEVDAVFGAVGAETSVSEKIIYDSAVFDEFYRMLAILQEGDRPDQELDTRVLRYDLIGKNAVKQRLAHQEKSEL